MPQKTFISTGITDGQPVEAFQVSQSVDAFTAQSDYRINQTGSYTLSGSLLMTGSLVNEFTGQFSALGLGVTAPTAPTMLHVKDTAVGGDPIVLLEANTGTDSARIRFSNTDVTYDVGVSSSDDFMVIQDQGGTPKFQFIIDKDVSSYTFYLSDTKAGIGLGASTTTLLTPLDAGSLQALGMVSGSKVIGQTISASAAGPLANIHGTASHAINVVTAETGSYVKFSNVDTYYTASGQANFDNNIATIQTASAHNFSFGKATAAITDGVSGETILSGSSQAGVFIGSINDGEFITTNGSGNQTIFTSGGNIFIDAATRTINKNEFRVSGSGTPQLIVGPPVGNIGSNNPSASLQHDSLEFHKSNVVYVGQYDSDSLSEIRIIGGGVLTSGFSMSSSADMELKLNDTSLSTQFNLNLGGRNSGNATMGVQAFSTGSYMLVGDMKRSFGGPVKVYYQVSQSQINQSTGAPDNDVSLWIWDDAVAGASFNNRTVVVKTHLCAGSMAVTGEGAYFEETTAFRGNGGTFTKIGTTTTSVNIESSNLADCITTISASGGHIFVKGSNSTNANVMWSGWVEVLSFSNTLGD